MSESMKSNHLDTRLRAYFNDESKGIRPDATRLDAIRRQVLAKADMAQPRKKSMWYQALVPIMALSVVLVVALGIVTLTPSEPDSNTELPASLAVFTEIAENSDDLSGMLYVLDSVAAKSTERLADDRMGLSLDSGYNDPLLELSGANELLIDFM